MNRKKEFKYFTIFNHEDEEKYLSEMHRKGWKLVKVTGFGMYHFEKCEPEDVVYQLDYNKEGMENKDEYILMFKDCGWEYIINYVGYSYFRKPASEMNSDEKIFSDDNSRLAMMKRVYKGRLIPLLIIFCATLVPQFIFTAIIDNNFILGTTYLAILTVYIFIFIKAGLKYSDYKKKKK